METIKRNLIFLIPYFGAVALYMWFDPIATEGLSDLAGLIIPLAGLAGLVWANAHSFSSFHHKAGQIAARIVVTAIIFAIVEAGTYAYCWHVRPALGMQLKMDQVANQPSDRTR